MQRAPSRGLLSCLVVFAATCGGCSAESSVQADIEFADLKSSDTPPNIILILADDLGYTDLGAFGGEIATPHLDALASQGVRFTNFHTAASCAPTRAMLVSGTDNHIAGMGTQGSLRTPLQIQHREYSNALLPEVPTFMEGLQAAGYRTYMAGKWHLGSAPESQPAARGFDRSFTLLEGGAGHFDATPMFESATAQWLEDGEAVTLPDDFYSSDTLTDRLMHYIASTPPAQPYFGYLAFTAPHWPLQAPPEEIAAYRGRYDEGWDVLRAQRMSGAKKMGVVPAHAQPVNDEAGMQDWSQLSLTERASALARMEVYAAMITRLDKNVGRLTEFLRARGELGNTVIVFSSDNGAEAHNMEIFGSNITWVPSRFDNTPANIGSKTSYVTLQASWARASAVPFRASKSKLSEGGIRVPAFVRLPVEGMPAGEVDASYMRIMDLAPTFLEIAGTPAPASMMGRSLWSRWQGGEGAYPADEAIAYELYGRRAAQMGDWKILWQEPPYGTNTWQLYDLARDPGEQIDISEQYPAIRDDLIAAWNSYADSVGVVLPEHPVSY